MVEGKTKSQRLRAVHQRPLLSCSIQKGIKRPASLLMRAFQFSGRGGRIRTYGLVVPNDARYRAALHPESRPMGRPVFCFSNSSSRKKPPNPKVRRLYKSSCSSVGVAGFEPTTSSTPCWRDTRLRYTPIGIGATKVRVYLRLVQARGK